MSTGRSGCRCCKVGVNLEYDVSNRKVVSLVGGHKVYMYHGRDDVDINNKAER
jgi:hypothetical protein